MRRRGLAAIGAACTLVLAAVSACNKDDAGGGAGPGATIKVGVLTSLSGPSSSTFTSSVGAVKARFAAYKEEGGKCSDRNFEVVPADDASGAQGGLSVSQKLVQQDQVYGIIEVTPYFFGAVQYLTTAGKNVPVIGGAFDAAPQWSDTGNNLFPSGAVPDYSKTYSTFGDYLKAVGATKLASVAYDNQASKNGMESGLKSAEAVGLKRAYANDTIPLGSTDVGAVIIGIMDSGADALYLPINPDTSFAIVAGLRRAGYKLKAILSATGYGSDLLKSAPAVQAGQGVSFSMAWAPSELNTPATQRMGKALKAHADTPSGIPGFAQAQGWLGADLFLHGLELAGCDASQADFMSKLRADGTWNAGGLYPAPHDFRVPTPATQCSYIATLKGDGFVPEPKASPICGKEVSS